MNWQEIIKVLQEDFIVYRELWNGLFFIGKDKNGFLAKGAILYFKPIEPWTHSASSSFGLWNPSLDDFFANDWKKFEGKMTRDNSGIYRADK